MTKKAIVDDERVMASDPFEEDDVLDHSFYQPSGHLTEVNTTGNAPGNAAHHDTKTRKRAKPAAKPTHYKTVSVSLYLDDIERIDNLVRELKRRGFTKMNRSALIRFAIDTVNIDDLPPQY